MFGQFRPKSEIPLPTCCHHLGLQGIISKLASRDPRAPLKTKDALLKKPFQAELFRNNAKATAVPNNALLHNKNIVLYGRCETRWMMNKHRSRYLTDGTQHKVRTARHCRAPRHNSIHWTDADESQLQVRTAMVTRTDNFLLPCEKSLDWWSAA